MSKKAKKKAKNQSERTDSIEIRPVTKVDRWCRFKSRLTQEQLQSEAPYGYVVTIPKYRNGMGLEVDGIIIKDKVFKGQLYLQVIMRKSRNYMTAVKTVPGVKRKNKKRKKSKKTTFRYMNIVNLDK